jgi:hypothetical protein
MQDRSLITTEPPEASTAEINTTTHAGAGANPWTRSAPPTLEVADSLQTLCDHFCRDLIEPEFGVLLPPVMLVMQRKGRAELGHYHPARFSTLDGAVTVAEISLNPRNIRTRDPIEVASTLLHELMHHHQHCHGKPGKGGYHNIEWGQAMVRVGLFPSHTGAEGGRMTGQQMDHYIIEGGPFARFWNDFVATGKVLSWGDAVPGTAGKTRTVTRTKFTCQTCGFASQSRASAQLVCFFCLPEWLKKATADYLMEPSP